MTCERRYYYVEDTMAIVYLLCCAFYQSTFPRALIVSQEVMHAIGRVRSKDRNENNNEIPPPSKHTATSSTVTRQLQRTQDHYVVETICDEILPTRWLKVARLCRCRVCGDQ